MGRRVAGAKKILIVSMEALVPRVTASRERIYRMVERLARDHAVDVATTVRDAAEAAESRALLRGVCRAFRPITPINPLGSQLRRKLRAAEFLLLHRPRHHPHHYFYGGHPRVLAQLADLVDRHRYDVVQAEYWYMGRLFERIGAGVFTAIDTHDVLSDRERQQVFRRHDDDPPPRARRALATYRELEIRCLRLADLVIAISADDQAAFAGLELGNQTLLVPIGQDLDRFTPDGAAVAKDDVVLFYGNLGGHNNVQAFFRLWRAIFPLIRQRVPGARLLVVGANPPDSIRRLHDGHGVIVTGFVEDVRPHLARAKVAVIPLDIAAGFRGRVVDLMALAVPVVGTRRALDCLQMTSGVHGFITDSDAEMAGHAARLLSDDALRLAMGARCRALAEERYTVEATYGVLSDYYLGLGGDVTPRRPDG